MTTTNDLRRLLAEASNPTGWTDMTGRVTRQPRFDGDKTAVAIVRSTNDAALIAAAVNALPGLLDELDAERAKVTQVEAEHRDLTRRLGFGDNVTEPQADNDTIVEFVDAAAMDQSEHTECPAVCELCGERLAATTCEHCHGSGGDNAAINASGAYAECEWCAGAGRVHEGCVERSYADLVAERDAAEAKVAALLDDETVALATAHYWHARQGVPLNAWLPPIDKRAMKAALRAALGATEGGAA